MTAAEYYAKYPNIEYYTTGEPGSGNDPAIIADFATRKAIGDRQVYGWHPNHIFLFPTLDDAKLYLPRRTYTLVDPPDVYTYVTDSGRTGKIKADSLEHAYDAVEEPITINGLAEYHTGIGKVVYFPVNTPDDVIALALTKYRPEGEFYWARTKGRSNLYVASNAYNWTSTHSAGTVTAKTLDEAVEAVKVPRGYPITTDDETRWSGGVAKYTGGVYLSPDAPDDVIGAAVAEHYPGNTSVVWSRVDGARSGLYVIPVKRKKHAVGGWSVYSSARTLADFTTEAFAFWDFFMGDDTKSLDVTFNDVKHMVTR